MPQHENAALLTLLLGHVDGDNLGLEAARSRRGGAAAVRLESVCILLLARNGELLGRVLATHALHVSLSAREIDGKDLITKHAGQDGLVLTM